MLLGSSVGKAVHRTLMTLSPGKVIEMRSLMPGKQIFNDALHTGFFVAVLYLSSLHVAGGERWLR